MKAYFNRTEKHQDRASANDVTVQKAANHSNNHPQAAAQMKLQELSNNSSRVKQLQCIQAMANSFTAQQSKLPIQKVDDDELPQHRLHPDIKAPSKEEWDAHNKKFNFGDGGSGQEDLERNTMNFRQNYATALNKLSAHPKWSHPKEKDGVSKSVKFKNVYNNDKYFNEALKYYVGPTEAGHSVYLGFRDNLRQLLKDAYLQGYGVNQPEIQKLIVEAATAKALMESNGLGSAGRSDMRR